MKITNQKLEELNLTLGEWIKNNEEESKFKYAIQVKIVPELKKHFEVYQAELEQISIDNCIEAEDEKTKAKRILIIDGVRQFDKNGQRNKNQQDKELWKKEIDFKSYIVKDSDIPELTFNEKRAFSGILIPEIQEEVD